MVSVKEMNNCSCKSFTKCHAVFAALQPQSRRVICDITQRMATGMAEFVDKDLGQGYCGYCSSTIGIATLSLDSLVKD